MSFTKKRFYLLFFFVVEAIDITQRVARGYDPYRIHIFILRLGELALLFESLALGAEFLGLRFKLLLVCLGRLAHRLLCRSDGHSAGESGEEDNGQADEGCHPGLSFRPCSAHDCAAVCPHSSPSSLELLAILEVKRSARDDLKIQALEDLPLICAGLQQGGGIDPDALNHLLGRFVRLHPVNALRRHLGG